MINDLQMASLLVGQEVVACGNDEIKDYIGRIVAWNDVNIRVQHPFDKQCRWYTRSELVLRDRPLDDIKAQVKKLSDRVVTKLPVMVNVSKVPGDIKYDVKSPWSDTLDDLGVVEEIRKNLAELNIRLMQAQKRGMSFKAEFEFAPDLQIKLAFTKDPFGGQI